MQPQIVCLGEPMLEFNCQSDGRYLSGHGGDTSNCAIAAARQGALSVGKAVQRMPMGVPASSMATRTRAGEEGGPGR